LAGGPVLIRFPAVRTLERSVLALLLLAACGGPSSTVPVHTAAVTFDPKTSKYQLSQVDLTTITDLETLTGSVAHLVGGANVVIDSNDQALKQATTNAELKKALLRDPGGPVRASFVTSGTTQFPADFDSENMVTTYFNFERAFSFYSKLGWTQAQAGTPDVFYFPSFIETDLSKTPLKDNAAFFGLIGGFMVLPFDQLQDIPLPMNVGIIGHEYSHFMVSTRVYDSEPIPKAYMDFGAFQAGVPAAPANLLKAFDEGFADLFGTGVTCGDHLDACDPNFIAASIGAVAASRNLAGKHCLDQTLNAHLMNDPFDTFLAGSHQYEVGTVLASSVWRAATDHDVVGALGQGPAMKAAMQSVYDALDDGSANGLGLRQALVQEKRTPNNFRIDTVLADLVVMHATDPKLGAALCSAFQDRLGTLDNLTCTGLCHGSTIDDTAVLVDRNNVATGCMCACLQYPTARSYGECAR
jgi:hypothetical protein